MIDYAKILTVNYPNLQWSLNGDSYDGLVWFSDTPKPTKDELDALWESTQVQENTKKQAVIDARMSALTKLYSLGFTVEEVEALLGLI